MSETEVTEKPYKCSVCDSRFLYKRNCLAHERLKHGGLGKQVKKTYKCSNHEFKKHEEIEHGVGVTRKSFQCDRCGALFSYLKCLREHIEIKHRVNLYIPKVKEFKCTLCNASFNRKGNLMRHNRKIHNLTAEVTSDNICSLCQQRGSKCQLLSHYTAVHGIKLRIKKEEFDSFDNFNTWKSCIEKETKSKFIRNRQCQTNKNSQKRHSFICHRSGFFKSKGQNLRQIKSQGSNKINGFCPAKIDVVEDVSGICKVDYQTTHVGHKNDLAYLQLTLEDRKDIASKLSMKISFESILDDIKNSVEGELDRKHFLTRKDLHNIKRAFNLVEDDIADIRNPVEGDMGRNNIKQEFNSVEDGIDIRNSVVGEQDREHLLTRKDLSNIKQEIDIVEECIDIRNSVEEELDRKYLLGRTDLCDIKQESNLAEHAIDDRNSVEGELNRKDLLTKKDLCNTKGLNLVKSGRKDPRSTSDLQETKMLLMKQYIDLVRSATTEEQINILTKNICTIKSVLSAADKTKSKLKLVSGTKTPRNKKIFEQKQNNEIS